MKVVEQIDKATEYNGQTTSDGKIAAVTDDGTVAYEVSKGDLHNYRVVATDGGSASVDTVQDVIDYINNQW